MYNVCFLCTLIKMAAVIREAGRTLFHEYLYYILIVKSTRLPSVSWYFSFFFTANHKSSPIWDLVGIHREADSQSVNFQLSKSVTFGHNNSG